MIPSQRIEPAVHSADRLWDALAMLLLVAGTTLFLLARNGLASIANGTSTLPRGITSYVERADYFSAQSSLGLTMIVVGVAVGLASTIRHALRRRASTPPVSIGA
jgi:bacteriorhodopsin